MKEIIKEIIEFDLDEGRMDYLDDMIDVFSKDGCEMVDILFDRFLKKYYADIDVSNERMTINLTDEEGHVLSFNLSQSEVHYVLTWSKEGSTALYGKLRGAKERAVWQGALRSGACAHRFHAENGSRH